MVNNLEKGIEMLKPLGNSALGLDLTGFDDALSRCMEEALRWRRGETEIFNRDFIPRVEFIGEPLDL